MFEDDTFDGDAVNYCPCCGNDNIDQEQMADGTIDFYCHICGNNGDISIFQD